MPESFVFYESYLKGIELQSEETQAKLFLAVCRYGLRGEQPQGLTDSELGIFELIRPTIDANTQRREASKKGGAPIGNQNARKKPKQPTVDSTKQPKRPNENETVNENEYVYENENETDKAQNAQGEDFSEVELTDEEIAELEKMSDRLSVKAYIKKLSDWQKQYQKRSHKAYTVIKGWINYDNAKQELSSTDKEENSFTVERLTALADSFMERNKDMINNW